MNRRPHPGESQQGSCMVPHLRDDLVAKVGSQQSHRRSRAPSLRLLSGARVGYLDSPCRVPRVPHPGKSQVGGSCMGAPPRVPTDRSSSVGWPSDDFVFFVKVGARETVSRLFLIRVGDQRKDGRDCDFPNRSCLARSATTAMAAIVNRFAAVVVAGLIFGAPGGN